MRDEEELQATLEHVDPEIFLLGGEPHDPDEPALDHVLELLPDVPAGKLAVAYLPDATHDEVEALERAGVDAVVVNASDVRELVGAEPPRSLNPSPAGAARRRSSGSSCSARLRSGSSACATACPTAGC